MRSPPASDAVRAPRPHRHDARRPNELAFVDELPALTARIAALGLPDVRLRHLPSNRREVCAVALPA